RIEDDSTAPPSPPDAGADGKNRQHHLSIRNQRDHYRNQRDDPERKALMSEEVNQQESPYPNAVSQPPSELPPSAEVQQGLRATSALIAHARTELGRVISGQTQGVE